MIKAVIFDCFGVLVGDGWHPFKKRYFADEPEKDAEASRLNVLSNKGLLSYTDFLEGVGKLAGISAYQVMKELNQNPPNTQLFDYIRTLKPNYKIGMLSNAAENWLSTLVGKENEALFDAVVLSYDIGHNKPSPEAYQKAARALGVNVDECVFIDDIESYVVAAEHAGMKGVLYRTPEDTIADITAALEDDK